MVEDVKSSHLENYTIGQRITCDSCCGTICYIGPVEGTAGIWLGIDWDNPTRGKHDGTYNGKMYFTTRHPTSGSFVRPGKVKTGVSCLEAIKNRYGLVDDELAGVDRKNVTMLRKEINAPFLEMVGFSKVNQKQSNFNQLKIVSLREQCVSTSGEAGTLLQLCPNIEELDLSKNLINSWTTVAEICLQLKKLDRLNVSENVMGVGAELNRINDAFVNVTQLTMALMNYSWRDIEICTGMFPALKILSVPFNNANFLETLNHSSLRKITTLTLEGNSINDWLEILKIGCLECLENLNLNSNNIERIMFPSDDCGEKTKMFPALRQLHLCNNLISEWSSVSELDKLQNLQDLKLRENPVLKQESPQTVRQLIIAKIANLKVLNSTEITDKERRDAEYDYMKLFAKDWLQLSGNNFDSAKKKFLSIHPRYPALVEKYGGPEVINSKADEMKSDVITVEFICMNEPSLQTKSYKRKVLNEMDVQRLTGIAQRLFKTGGKIPTLSFVQPQLSKEEIPLDKPLQQLRYYSIQNGDRVLVRW